MSEIFMLASLLLKHRETGVLATLPLPSDGAVVVAGAYKGDTVDFLRTLHGPDLRILAYEPQLWAVDILRERFGHDPNVTVRPYGLGIQDGNFDMAEFGTDGCTFEARGAHSLTQWGHGDMADAVQALQREGVSLLDLAVFNMEGYEYRLLPYLAEHRWIERIRYLLVQFHHAQSMPYQKMRELFAETHDVFWDYGPSWVCWRLREPVGAL